LSRVDKVPLRIAVDDAVELEAEWDVPTEPLVSIVFCHPNPLDGGTMHAPLMRTVTERLVDHGAAVLRFNFRGVGNSTGEHGRGVPEIHDVAAAVGEAGMRFDGGPVAVCGWSFGAVTALRWQAASGSQHPYVGIAPPVFKEGVPILPAAPELATTQRSFILGDRDQFASVEDLARYAASIEASLTVLEGSDHFFYFREHKVVEAIVAALGISPASA